MKSSDESPRYPTADEVIDGIGEKPTAAFARAVRRTKTDLRAYRQAFPQWVADHSERGLANWIHDRLWAHLVEQADAIPGMETVERGVTREIVIGFNYRFRVKRHSEEGNVESYPTPTFLDFVCQPASQLPGMEETRLIAGYDWDRELREMGDAAISLRDGKESVIWKSPLPDVDEDEAGGTAPVTTPEKPGPTAPKVDIPKEVGKKKGADAEDE